MLGRWWGKSALLTCRSIAREGSLCFTHLHYDGILPFERVVAMAEGKFNKPQRMRFLKHYIEFGLLYLAAEAAGVTTQTVRNHRSSNPEFDELCTDALEYFRDTLEAEAIRRAHDGVDTEHYFRGEHTHTETKYSDTLLITLLKRHRKEYRDKIDIDATVRGGLLVVPEEAVTSKDWEKNETSGNKGNAKGK